MNYHHHDNIRNQRKLKNNESSKIKQSRGLKRERRYHDERTEIETKGVNYKRTFLGTKSFLTITRENF